MMGDVAFTPEENKSVERRRGRKRKPTQDKVNQTRQPKPPPVNEVSKIYILVLPN